MSTLSLRELEVFKRVMELGSITSAAHALNVSQPAASRLILQAEARLGFALFLRQKKRLIPTWEAQALFPEAVSAFAALDSVNRLARDMKSGQSGTLTIAAIPALANSVLPIAVQKFHAAHNGVLVKIQAVNAHECANLVADQRADLGLIIGPMTNSKVSMTDLCSTPVGCVLPAKHKLARKPYIRPQDIHTEPLIGLSRHLPLGTQVSRVFAEANIPLRIAFEVTQSTIAMALVRENAGIALLDGFAMLGATSDGLVLRPLRPKVNSIARILFCRQRPTSRLAEEFTRILHAASDGLHRKGLLPRNSKVR